LPTEHEEEIVHGIKDGDNNQTREKNLYTKKYIHPLKKTHNKT